MCDIESEEERFPADKTFHTMVSTKHFLNPIILKPGEIFKRRLFTSYFDG